METDIDGKSLDIKAQKLEQLKEIFPDFFSEGRLDLKRIKDLLTDEELAGPDHFELSWAGKAEARREIQKQTSGTLLADKDKSIDFDNSNNILIEGENLEVLRVLQKSYFGQVKMIYIDPPYNTGSDSFIYPDDYAERREEYEKRTGVKNGDGYLNKLDLYKKNAKENGQYHSTWLSMMYPRLYLARNLLSKDGLIFVQIDDNEEHNLVGLLNEIFGEENFVSKVCVKMSHLSGMKMSHKEKKLPKIKEFILIYARNKEEVSLNPVYIQGDWETVLDRYDYIVDKENKDCSKWTVTNLNAHLRNLGLTDEKAISKFRIENADRIFRTATNDALAAQPHESVFRAITTTTGLEKYIYKGEEVLFASTKLRVIDGETVPVNTLGDIWTDIGINNLHNEGFVAFENGKKPIKLIKRLISMATDKEDKAPIIMDFFAGSGTTAHAVLELNKEDGGDRTFICVQMPEPNEKSGGEGFKTISELCRTRIVKVIEQLRSGTKDKKISRSQNFRFYHLSYTHFKKWNDQVSSSEDLLKQLEIFKQPLSSIPDDSYSLLVELLLKSGFSLSGMVKHNVTSDGVPYYIVEDKVAFALDKISDTLLVEIERVKPESFIVLSSLFEGEKADERMNNWKLQLSEADIEFKKI